MSHAYHQELPGYDARQILHDGCGECEYRAENVERALGHMDDKRFEKAWLRAFNEFGSDGTPDGGPRSAAEMPVLTALWGVMLHLQRRGIPLDGVAPSRSAVDWLDDVMVKVAGDLLGADARVGARIASRVMREVAAAGRSIEDQLAVADAAIHAWTNLP